MTSSPATQDSVVPARAGILDYVSLARPSHWIKHVFILPGIVLAALLLSREVGGLLPVILTGLASAVLIASANYVLNEWLDARTDAFHPTKRGRPAVAKRLSLTVVALEYLLLAVAGLAIAWLVSLLYAVTSAVFLASAWVYNVPPLRTKDIPYLDVLTESLNNPIRLTLGWAMVDSHTLPPGSLLLGYWMGGAFLMAIKRLAEYRTLSGVGGAESPELYRKSFGRYTESSLMVSSLIYAMLSGFFVAVFFVKYRIEYLLALPALALLFGAYLSAGLKVDSRVQTPEKLFREWRMLSVVAVLVLLLVGLTWFDIPLLHRLTEAHYIELPFD